MLAVESEDFETGEKLRIGREGRAKIVSVFGKLAYEDLTAEAKAQLLGVCEIIVKNNEAEIRRVLQRIATPHAAPPRTRADLRE